MSLIVGAIVGLIASVIMINIKLNDIEDILTAILNSLRDEEKCKTKRKK